MSLFRAPRNPDFLSIPAVLSLVYFTSYSTTSPFTDIRARLPLWLTDYAFPVLFYVHIAEAAYAAIRSIRAGRPVTETAKWAAATMIWGFASLNTQAKALKL